MSDTKKKLMILDGNALIHRSFHALPPTLTTKKGEMVNAVYGFTAVLLKAIREFRPDYIALTLDRAAPTFRHKEYKEYKATRVKAPDELYGQIPRVKEIAQTFNIPIYEQDGFEADDLIGTISRTVDGNVEKIIVTGDLDTLQLINEHTKVYTMKRGLTDAVLYDEKAVKQRYGLKPEQMIDFKALRGDPSDNIPGVRGIGEKTAVELLKDFKTLDNVYKNINSEKIKNRVRDLLKQHKEDALMSKKLAAIDCAVKINFKLEEARFSGFDREKTVRLFSELEFKSLLPRLQSISIKQQGNKSKEHREVSIANKFERNIKLFKYHLIDNEKDFEKFFIKLAKVKEFAFDTETASLDSISAELLGMSFSWKAGEAYYIKIKNQKSKIKNNLFDYNNNNEKSNENIEWIKRLKPILENPKIKKFGHNIKYDIKVMKCYGININGVEADTMIASYLLNPGTRQHNLDALAFTELGHQKITKEDLLGNGREKQEFSEAPINKLYNYSCEDADFTYRLAKKLLPELKKQKLDKLFEKIEMPLIQVLVEMERNGIKIDGNFLKKMGEKAEKKIKQLEEKICEMAGVKFNISSTRQLREILYEKLEIPVDNITKIKTGLSTSAEELEKLKDSHPIIRLIQEYRELTKLLTTYINALPKLINPKTGRLHTSFNQTVTATGRLSSSDPNLQNIPVRTELGKKIRHAFIADAGYKLLSLDYSQIELRLAAHMSGDKKMIKAFNNGADIHRMTAAEINRVSPEAVTGEMRRQAKAVNFGILYGQGPRGLAQGADIPYARAKEFIEQYFNAYKDVKKYINETIEKAKDKGYTETLFGRVRYLPEINSSVLQVSKTAERMAINTPLQGTAADMIKIAMIKINARINSNSDNTKIKMLLQVHDELLFEVKENIIEETVKEIKKIMENVIKLKVPVIVDAKAGDNWGEMKKI